MTPADQISRFASYLLRKLAPFFILGAIFYAAWLFEHGYFNTLLFVAFAGVALAATLLALAPARTQRTKPTVDALAQSDAKAGRLRILRQAWVIDGDTIDDRRTGIRYRFQNIDAPETGDNARCEAERRLGERAKWTAIELLRVARKIEARPTGEIDQYGRTLAYILLDGRDLGQTLIARGLARPWRGRRELWCGPDGSLLTIARQRGDHFMCQECRLQWRP